MKKIKSVADYIVHSEHWSAELRALRKIIQQTELDETIKWGAPCYTYKGKNVVGMASFQHYFGLWFHQGALLTDSNNKLINAQEGKTKALRQWRMSHKRDIKPSIIKRYIKESIANFDQGHEIKPRKAKSFSVPVELRQALTRNQKTRKAFDKLTPGKQREYAEYISEASRASTKARRVEKIIPMIQKGQGLNDRYR